jgi:hypothetical protein
MHRKAADTSSSAPAGISKRNADDVPRDIASISLRGGHKAAAVLVPKTRARRNAVVSASVACHALEGIQSEASSGAVIDASSASACSSSSTRILFNVSSKSNSAVNIHIEALAHGTALSHASRGIVIRALQRCFLFADVSISVLSCMCDHAREVFVSGNSVLQAEGSECVSAFVSLDAAFSSNGSGGAASMLSCEESFVLGHMVCSSNVTLLHPSHVAVLPAPCFAACAETQGRFENSMISAAASVFPRLQSRDLRQPACRVFLHHSRGRVNLSGWAYERMPSAHTVALESRWSAVCVLVVFGSCHLHTGIASPVNALRAGAVIITTRDNIELSPIGQVSYFELNYASYKNT